VALRAAGDRRAPVAAFPARLETLDVVDSTNDVVAGWLRDGTPEVCVAVADRQSAGRGRLGRTWLAPAGAALLCSVGFRPSWLAPDRVWRLAAVVALAMADAGEDVAGLPEGTIRLKWPNDLVVPFGASGRPFGDGAELAPDTPIEVRKLAGLLGETDGLGTADPRAVIGIGINADWPAAAFPPKLAHEMTSLSDASGGRSIDRAQLLEAFLGRLEGRVEALRGGHFDVSGWSSRQLTNGRRVRLEHPDGSAEIVPAIGVDALTGALIVAGEREVLAGEIRHLRLDPGGITDAVGV
jgi:BirA family transcriptional regulator, biotin operon repressor / biotin---[acetyl-CoA-carboxylase] ligase